MAGSRDGAVCFCQKLAHNVVVLSGRQQAAGSTIWCSSLTACPSPINFTYFTGRRPLNITNERTFAHIKIKFPHKLPAQHFWWHFLPPPTAALSFPSSISNLFSLLMCKHNWGFYSTQVSVCVCAVGCVCLFIFTTIENLVIIVWHAMRW